LCLHANRFAKFFGCVVNNTHAEIPSLSRGFVGSDLENMFGKDAQCGSDNTCVQPKKVSFFLLFCSLKI
jgi:hypothetical protein